MHGSWEPNLGPLQSGRHSELLSLLSNPSTSSFLWLNNTPLHGYTLCCLCLLQMIGTLAIINNDVMIIHVQSLQRQMLSWFLDTYLGVEAVGDLVTLSLTFGGPKAAAPFCHPTSNISQFQFVHLLVNTCYCLSCRFSPPVCG